MLTPEQLSEIEKRLNAATPGPWERDCFLVTEKGYVRHPYRQICHTGQGMRRDGAESERNANFIAHAWEDIELLLREVRRLQRELFP